MTETEKYAQYLSNLLIIQYHNKPKAKATIELLAKTLPVDLIFAVRDGFNLDTAVGKQLDILGKYVGTDRFYLAEDGEIITLTDEEFRFLLKMKCVANTTDCSHKSIDESLYSFFGTNVRATSAGNMEMVFFLRDGTDRVIQAAIQKNCFPKPMGVGVKFVIVRPQKTFGFVTHDDLYHEYTTGFRTYDEPDKEGGMLTYDNILDIVER